MAFSDRCHWVTLIFCFGMLQLAGLCFPWYRQMCIRSLSEIRLDPCEFHLQFMDDVVNCLGVRVGQCAVGPHMLRIHLRSGEASAVNSHAQNVAVQPELGRIDGNFFQRQDVFP